MTRVISDNRPDNDKSSGRMGKLFYDSAKYSNQLTISWKIYANYRQG